MAGKKPLNKSKTVVKKALVNIESLTPTQQIKYHKARIIHHIEQKHLIERKLDREEHSSTRQRDLENKLNHHISSIQKHQKGLINAQRVFESA